MSAGRALFRLHPGDGDAGLVFAADVPASFVNERPSEDTTLTLDSMSFAANGVTIESGFQ